MISVKTIVLFTFVFFAGLVSNLTSGEAYEDSVAAPYVEVFRAAEKALASVDIQKSNIEAGVIETSWSDPEKFIRRSRAFYGLGWKVKKAYLRRGRYHIQMKGWPTYTDLAVKSVLQYRRADAGKAARWRKLDPGDDAREMERKIFLDILQQMEQTRRGASSQ